MTYTKLEGIKTLDKRVEDCWKDEKGGKGSGRPEFGTLRDFILNLKTDAGNPVFYSVIPRMSGFDTDVITLGLSSTQRRIQGNWS